MKRKLVVSALCVVPILLALAACSGPAPAQPAAEPAAAEQAPAAVQAPASGDLPSGAAEFPEAPALDLGKVEVNRQPIDEIVTYKALSEYHEPAWVTDLVNRGKLPPVAERLPKEPQVVLASGMPTGIGV